MFLLLVFAFLSGLVTILAPCIWPVLPIVLSSSIVGKNTGHKRPLGITLGVMLSFTIFTLSVSTLVRVFHLDPNILRIFAVIIIGFLGLTMLIPALATQFELLVSKLSNIFGQNSNTPSSGFLPGFITGLSLGIVWSPCAGPILATIATLAATGKVNFDVILVTIAYVIGVGIPLFVFAYGGQRFVNKARGLSKFTARIQQAFGIIMILAAIAIFTNLDQTLQLKLLNTFPQLGTAVNGFESGDIVQKQLALLKGQKFTSSGDSSGLFNANSPALDFVGVTKWLNLPPRLASPHMQDLKGKVVLVDFWTYTCINCIRTLPFVTSWYDKYKDKGFVVIGVHTPEFEFEKDTNNVLGAIKKYNIHYPVPQDNNFATWNNFNNQYWPAEYLIDANGIIRRTHFGEGEYDQMEMAIQLLLKEAGQKVSAPLADMPDQTPHIQLSPETYLNAQRMQYYYPGGSTGVGKKVFILSNNPPQDSFSLGGEWNITDDYAGSGKDAVLVYHFTGDKVFLVLNPPAGKTAKIKVLLDGKVVTGTNSGEDVIDGVVTIDSDRLYNLIDLHGHPGSHMLRLEFQTPGTNAFAFTFG